LPFSPLSDLGLCATSTKSFSRREPEVTVGRPERETNNTVRYTVR
jgi:hypothetical protein